MITFTLDSPQRFCYQIKFDQDGTPLFRDTLIPLGGLREPVPILFEEAYRADRLDRTGLDLLLQLRMEVEMEASRFPVYVRLYSPLEMHVREHPRYAVLCTPGVTLLREEQAISEVQRPEPLEKTGGVASQLSVLESLSIRLARGGGRHDLANRWGPIRLWRGMQRLRPAEELVANPQWVDDLDKRLKADLPYAHLLAMAALRSEGMSRAESKTGAYEEWKKFLSENSRRNFRLLLLDDEVKTGWGDAVAEILKSAILDVDVSLAGVDFEREEAIVVAKIEEGWDLVLADLRISQEDKNLANVRGVRHYLGARWIERIKRDHPETAVIAFTASNKASSLEELYDLGVDGYWLKESPEFGVDDQYSKENAGRLLDVVRNALQPRIDARPIWDLITALEERMNTADNLYVSGWQNRAMAFVAHPRQRLDAIVKRLRRAYGLYVMKQSSHAGREFALYREDLAFLSLWSVINEVVALYFGDSAAQRDQSGDKIADTMLIERLLEELNRIDLMRRFAGPSGGVNSRPSLRYLRNHLEEIHGRLKVRDKKTVPTIHATRDDIIALCNVWQTLLLAPDDTL